MNEVPLFVGIDISKDRLDVAAGLQARRGRSPTIRRESIP